MRKAVLCLSALLISGCASNAGQKGFAQFPGEPAPKPTAAVAPTPSTPAATSPKLDPVDLPTPPALTVIAPKEEPKAGEPEKRPAPRPANNRARVQLASAEVPAEPKPDVSKLAAADPMPFFRPVVNLAILRFSLPQGALSQNESFWKRIDEQSVDAATYDVLFKNGVRVGRAPMVDLDYLIRNLEQQGSPKPHQMTYAASGTKLVEYPMKDVADQIIYWFDRQNVMSMRSYDASENVFCVEFEPAPRKAGDVRVSLCPMVRTLRKRLAVVGEGDELEVQYRSPERRYELNLRADIPLDSVLIIAPSPEARSRMSVGHSFLVHSGATGLMEDVLLLVPQAVDKSERAQAANPLPPPDEGGAIPDQR